MINLLLGFNPTQDYAILKRELQQAAQTWRSTGERPHKQSKTFCQTFLDGFIKGLIT